MIYLLRHGLDDERYIGGWSDVPLLEEGIEQVERAAQFMKNNNINFDVIYSSDIKRAYETAKIVSKVIDVQVILDSRLRELDKGLLTGLHKEEARLLYPDFIKNVSISTKYPNGESMLDLYRRQKEVLKWLLTLDNVLIVTHRGPINMYYFTLNHEELTSDKEKFKVTHASLHELDSKQKVLRKIFDPKED